MEFIKYSPPPGQKEVFITIGKFISARRHFEKERRCVKIRVLWESQDTGLVTQNASEQKQIGKPGSCKRK